MPLLSKAGASSLDTPVSYDAISEKLGQMDAKLDTMLETKADHEGRIRGLEKRERWLAGAGGMLGVMWAYLVGK